MSSPNPDDLDLITSPTVVLIDDFDGVHVGHQRFIAQALASAQEHGRRIAALGLNIMQPERHGQRRFLTPPDTQQRILHTLGCDAAPIYDLRTSAHCDHISQLLRKAANVDSIVIAQTLTRNALGQALIEAQTQTGKLVDTACTLAYYENMPITRERIQHHLQDGDLPLVTACMGRYFEVAGVVEHGQEMGRRLGFPTANLHIDPRQMLPPVGGYATFVWDDNTRYMAATNVGKNPSVGGVDLAVEAHLLDFDGDLYGKYLRVAFVDWLSGERAFSDLAALQAYIRASISKTRSLLLNHKQ